MPSTQESIRAALGADATLTAIVEDRIYPGQIPDEDDPTPWLFYAVLESIPSDELSGGDEVREQYEFHALADTYAEAKAIIDAVLGVLDTFSGGQITRAFWRGTSEETTEDGYHHVARFDVWGKSSVNLPAAGPNVSISQGPDSLTFSAGGHTLTLNSDGLELDGDQVPFDATALGLTAGRVVYYDGAALASALRVSYAASGTLVTVAAAANGDVPIRVEGNGTGGTHTGDLMQWRDKDGRTGKINNRGAVLAPNAPTTLDGGNIDIGSASGSYWGISTMRISGDDAADNHFYQTDSARNIGFAVKDVVGRRIVFKTTDRRISSFELATSTTPNQTFWGSSSTTSNREMGTAVGVWADNTDATRKARMVWSVYDTAAREYLRGEASGSAPMIGFLGAAAVARPTVTGSRGGNAALASALTALANLGLITDSSTA